MTKRSYRKKKNGAQQKAQQNGVLPTAGKTSKTPAPAAEPTFTLLELRRSFGWNFGGIPGSAEPLDVACDVIDDVKRTIFLVNNVIDANDENGVSDVLTNVWNRCEAALEILNKFRPCVLAKAEVQS